MTGVLVFGSLLLQAINVRAQRGNKNFLTQRRKGAKEKQGKIFAPLRLCAKTALVVPLLLRISDLFIAVILDWISLILFVREWFTGDAILTFNPLAKVDKLAPLGTEGAKRVVFPLGRLTAGWAFHEFEPPERLTFRAMPVVLSVFVV